MCTTESIILKVKIIITNGHHFNWDGVNILYHERNKKVRINGDVIYNYKEREGDKANI